MRVSDDRALAHAKADFRLAILADAGIVYLGVISHAMTATGQNRRLLKFSGQVVTAAGSRSSAAGCAPSGPGGLRPCLARKYVCRKRL